MLLSDITQFTTVPNFNMIRQFLTLLCLPQSFRTHT